MNAMQCVAGTGKKVTIVKYDGNHIGGNFTLGYKGYTSSGVLPYNATSAQVKNYLEQLHSIPPGTVSVSRSGPDLQEGQ